MIRKAIWMKWFITKARCPTLKLAVNAKRGANRFYAYQESDSIFGARRHLIFPDIRKDTGKNPSV